MTPPHSKADLPGVLRWLREQLGERVSDEGQTWLEEQRAHIADEAPDWRFFISFSAVPRHTGKADLRPSDEALEEADALRAGWRPGGWSVDQAGRTLLLLSRAQADGGFLEALGKIFDTADMGESVALYQSLPVLPQPDQLRKQAAEGLRSNITSVFNAVALHNPYPAECFDDGAWNQMVLKALFVGSPLHPIQGLDRRANAKLARMLVDYAHERWAADRSVTPELWRPVGPFAEGDMIDDLERVLAHDDPAQQEAAALALAQSPSPRAQELLADYPELQTRIEEGALTWDRFSRERLESNAI